MVEELEQLVRGARFPVAFTGAGVSTLAGIRDFRGKDGLYRDPEAARMFDLDRFLVDPGFFYRHARDLLYGLDDRQPGLVHRVLARWESEGWLKAVVTQNVDYLHQRAGSRRVVEVHGTPATHRCFTCGEVETFDGIRRRLASGEAVPRCGCGGVYKPDITFFGEALPSGAWDEAEALMGQADLLLVLGTSLTVYPAAALPELCHRSGGRLVSVNDQPTPLDHLMARRYPDLETAFS